MTSVTAGYGTTGRSTRSLARSLNPAILTPAIRPGRDGTAMSHTAAAARIGSAGRMPPWYGAPAAAAPTRHSSKTQPGTCDDAGTKHPDRKGQLVMKYPIDPFMPAVELAAAIRRKEVSPVEVADCYLDGIDELDPRLNAFCHRADDDVRKAASAAADAVVRAASAEDLPPFHGVPLPVKDLLDVAGWPTTHGSAGASKAPAAASDPVVQRFVDAGFVLLGKTTTSEFGTVPFTESQALGISRNPWDPDRTPGGSSGGAGAAVAAGMAPIAHAVDGGGSIRVPASCNGLVGLKPTRGLVTSLTVSLEGLATSGVLTRSVADTAAALDVLARHDPAAWWSPPTPPTPFAAAMTMDPPTGLRIGVLASSPIDGLAVDPACAAAVDTTVSALASAGHHVVDAPLPLPPPGELIAAFTTIWNIAGA